MFAPTKIKSAAAPFIKVLEAYDGREPAIDPGHIVLQGGDGLNVRLYELRDLVTAIKGLS